MWKIGLQYALRNIKRTPMRSFFTIFSIALIIMLYTILSGIGVSFTKELSRVLEAKNIDIILQSRFSATPFSSSISDATVQEITQWPEVHATQRVIVGRKRIDTHTKILLIGTTQFSPLASQLGITIVKGRRFANEGEAIVAKQVAKSAHLKIGDVIRLGGERSVTLTGIYETWLGFLNASLFTSLQTAQQMFNKKGKTNILFIALKDPSKTEEMISKINRDYKDLQAIKSGDFTQSMGVLKAMFYLLRIVSVLTLVIASAIMLNTFMMAISERRKELGILLAIGWSAKMITLTLWMEAMILALLGALCGYLFAYPVLYYLRSTYQYISIYLPTGFGIEQLIQVSVMALMISTISILFPALFSTRANVSKALRDE